MKKSKKHQDLVEDYDNQKAKHLEKLAKTKKNLRYILFLIVSS